MMNSIPLRAWIVGAAMCLASTAAYLATPTIMLADKLPKITLENDIPKQFGDWKIDESQGFAPVDPQLQATIEATYTDTLGRIYRNSKGEVVILSIAYGRNRTDDTNYHVPEVCYPAQGFNIIQRTIDDIVINGKPQRVKHLLASREGVREPLTYWIVVGSHTVLNGTTHKVAHIRYGFEGIIPDGMIVRASSRGPDTAAEYEMQTRFLNDLFRALPAQLRERVFGSHVTNT